MKAACIRLPMIARLGLLLTGLATCVGGSNAEPVPPKGAAPPAPGAAVPGQSVLKRLDPLDAGPGILVCEPVAQSAGPAMVRLGNGCARWLHLQVGGQGAFGKTPTFGEAASVLSALGPLKPGGEAARARSLARHLALTHLALGEVSGTEAQGKLVFRVVLASTLKPVGEPVVLAGSAAEVVRRLPEAARQLCRRLGAPQAEVAEVVETPADLQLLGSLPWIPRHEVSRAQVLRLDTLAERSVLAGMAAVGHITLIRDNRFQEDVQYRTDMWKASMRLGQLAGGNSLALGVAVYGVTYSDIVDDLGPLVRAEKALVARFPHNYALRRAEASLAAYRGEAPLAFLAAETAVRCNPRSRYAWSALANQLQGSAEVLRMGRTVDLISPEEWARLAPLYGKELELRKRAVQLDPTSSDAWYGLSGTATFAGDGKLADQALWKSIALDPGSSSAYHWGLEIYQPKWFNDEAKLHKIERLAIRAPYRYRADRWYIAAYWQRRARTDLVTALLRDPEDRRAFLKDMQEERGLGAPETPEEQRLTVIAPGPPRLYSHNASARGVDWSRSGTRLVSGANDRMVKVWTPQKNAWQVLSLVGHTAGVVHVAWSPDETKVASASDDQTIRIWNVETAAIVHTLEGHRAVVRRVAWSPDGRTLLSGSDDGDARLWDAQTGRALHVLNGGGGAIYHVAFDPTGKQVAIAGVYTRAISFWDVATGKRVREIPQPGGVGVWAWAWSPDGRYIATGDDARLVRIWDAQTGKEVRPPSITGNTVISLAWSPDSRFIAAGSTDRSIYVWTAADGALQRKLKGHQGEPLGLAWNGKHPLLASAGSDGDVRFWDMAGMPADTGVPRPTPAPSVVSRAPEALPLEGERGRITRMRLSTGGQTLAVQSAAPGVGLHDPATGGLLRRVQETGPVSGFDLSPDGQTLFTASGPRLTAWKAGTGAALWTWEGKAEHPTELQVTPDGAQVAGVDEGNHHVLFWTAQTGQLLRTVAADGQVSSLAFSPDGQTLVYGNGLKSRMGFVTVRDAAGSKEPRLLDGYRDLVPGVALSPDGQWVAGASLDRTLKLWSWPSGKEAGTLSGHLGPVRQVAFFPNGKWLASAGDDGAVRLWDLAGSREIQAIGNPAERAGPFALSPDGRTLLVARENPDPNGAPTVEQWRAQ